MSDNNRRDEILQHLTDGITQLATSDRWTEWLAVQSKFHRYSFNNTLLIQLQCHEATRVAGFQAWRKLGRNVRKGEKAIWILAPVARTQTVVDEDAGTETRQRSVVAFKPACVFDISQTDGEELPEIVTRLQGDDVGGAYTRLADIGRALGFTVEEDYLPGSCNGKCDYIERRITVEVRNQPAQQVKTLAHELAHAILHEDVKDRALAELEAESVAYVVCAALGIDSSEYSFGYVRTWAGGGDEAVAAIRSTGARIQRTADDIIGRVEAAAAVSTAA